MTYQTANPDDEVPITSNHFMHWRIGEEFAPDSVHEATATRRHEKNDVVLIVDPNTPGGKWLLGSVRNNSSNRWTGKSSESSAWK